MDKNLTKLEIEEAIDSIKAGKSPGLDGLPAEFFQTFKELLVTPLLSVWNEATLHQALPYSLNTGVIKLIHKRGPKNKISN